MLSPAAGLLPAGHGFQRGDWVLATFPETGTPGRAAAGRRADGGAQFDQLDQFDPPGIMITSRGDVSVEAEVMAIVPPPGQGILVKFVGELGKKAGREPMAVEGRDEVLGR